MERLKLMVYTESEFEKFYKKYSADYKIISISSLLNTSLQLEKVKLDNNKYIIDVTSLVKLAVRRDDLLLFSEICISQIIKNNDNINFVIEEKEKNKALNIFSNYFYCTGEFSNKNNDIILKEFKVSTSRRNIISVYIKDHISHYINIRKKENIKVISIADIIKKKNLNDFDLDISSLDSSKSYEIDITSAMDLIKICPDLIISIEIALFELSKNNRITFSIEKDRVNECRNIFHHIFEKYIEISESHEGNSNSKISLTITHKEDEIDIFTESFNNQLFGHENFKKDLKQQLKAFSILNKMGKKKIFSIFLCGNSRLGKIRVFKMLQKALYPNCNEIKINIGNYLDKGSLGSLIRYTKSYILSEKGGDLTNKIKNSNSKIVLIDEFEKADSLIYNFFYELLQNGKYIDSYRNELDLDGYIFVFTSNLCSKDYKNAISELLLLQFDMKYEFNNLTQQDKDKFLETILINYIETYKKMGRHILAPPLCDIKLLYQNLI